MDHPFFSPGRLTPVCTADLMAFAKPEKEFAKRNVALLGNSIDSVFRHIAWVRSIKQNVSVDINYPIIADLDMKVSKLEGMLHESSSNTAMVRAVFVMDPDRKLRGLIYNPLNVGRNFDEILRLVDALQTADSKAVILPANGCPGDKVIVPPLPQQRRRRNGSMIRTTRLLIGTSLEKVLRRTYQLPRSPTTWMQGGSPWSRHFCRSFCTEVSGPDRNDRRVNRMR